MLHDLVQFCPDGEAQTRIFRYLFLQRLPTEIRIILAEDRDSTLAALVAQANQLWAHSTRQPHDAAVNAVLEEEGHETIAAVSHSHHFRGGGRGRGGQSRPFRGRGGAGGRQPERSRQAGQADLRTLQVPLAVRRQGLQLPAPLLLAGKLESRGRLNTVIPGSLAHIVDQSSGRRFLIDTGASFSIMPYKSSLKPQGQRLAGPDGQSIPCWGERKMDLIFNGRRFPGPSCWLTCSSPSSASISCAISASW